MIDIPATLTLILSGLRAAVGAYMAQRRRTPGVVWLGTHAYTPVVAPQTAFERTIAAIPAETCTLLLTRIGRINGRLHALYHHWRAGTRPKPAPSRPGRPPSPPALPQPRHRPPAARLGPPAQNTPACYPQAAPTQTAPHHPPPPPHPPGLPGFAKTPPMTATAHPRLKYYDIITNTAPSHPRPSR